MMTNIVRLRVADHRGRTVAYLEKHTTIDEDGTPSTEGWSAPSKPMRERPAGAPFVRGLAPRPPVARSGDHLNLVLPGLTVNLTKLAPQLDRFAAAFGLVDDSGHAIVCTDQANTPTVSVSQIRSMANMH